MTGWDPRNLRRRALPDGRSSSPITQPDGSGASSSLRHQAAAAAAFTRFGVEAEDLGHRLARHDHRHPRHLSNGFADRAHQHPGESAATPAADHDQLGLFGPLRQAGVPAEPARRYGLPARRDTVPANPPNARPIPLRPSIVLRANRFRATPIHRDRSMRAERSSPLGGARPHRRRSRSPTQMLASRRCRLTPAPDWHPASTGPLRGRSRPGSAHDGAVPN